MSNDFTTLRTIDAVVSDMDGVLYRSNDPLPGMAAFIAFLRARNIPFALATNNSSRHPSEYVQKLAAMRVPDIEEWQIISSGTTTVDYLQHTYEPGTRVHVVGHDGLRRMIREGGFVVADDHVVAVIVGIDWEFSYEKAKHAARLIRYHQAAFIGTNPDETFPTPEGLVPGAGSIIAMIRAAVDLEPLILGKPASAMFESALKRLGTTPERTLMLGDRLNTDIAGANAIGMRTALLLTGVSSRDDIDDVQPDHVFDDLVALRQAWESIENIG